MKKTIKIIIYSYIIYFLFSSVILLKITKPKKTNIKYDKSLIHQTSDDNIYTNIIETSNDALDIRLNIINEAKETINISYLNIYSDDTGRLFYGALFKKANEGVKINIIIAGFNITKDDIFKAATSHENINYYVYEKINPLIPQTINNTLHDKIITIDNNYGLLGGRNISNKYLLKDFEHMAYDRDILLYNQNSSIDVISSMNEYLNELYNSKYSKKHKKYNSDYTNIYNTLIKEYNDYLINVKSLNDFTNESIKVENATFIRSPLNRGNKEPVLFNVIEDLMEDYNTMTYQTPYITTSRLMKKTFNSYSNKDITFITNNINTNPNIPALSNYILNRKKIANKSNLYELQKEYSMHAKSLTIGDDISIISSLNLDNRSMFLSTESMVVIKSKSFNKELSNIFNELIDNSLLVLNDGKYEKSELVIAQDKKTFKLIFVRIISLITRFTKEILSVKI